MTGRRATITLFDAAYVAALFEVLGEHTGRRLFENFADTLIGETRTIAAAAAAGNMLETGRQAHSLKGAAANFGAARLQAALRDIELAAHTTTVTRALDPLLLKLMRVARTTSSAARRM